MCLEADPVERKQDLLSRPPSVQCRPIRFQIRGSSGSGSGASSSGGGGGGGEAATAASGGLSAVMSTMSDLKNGFAERGEKLNQLSDKTQELEDASSEFERMCKELEKQQRRRWF